MNIKRKFIFFAPVVAVGALFFAQNALAVPCTCRVTVEGGVPHCGPDTKFFAPEIADAYSVFDLAKVYLREGAAGCTESNAVRDFLRQEFILRETYSKCLPDTERPLRDNSKCYAWENLASSRAIIVETEPDGEPIGGGACITDSDDDVLRPCAAGLTADYSDSERRMTVFVLDTEEKCANVRVRQESGLAGTDYFEMLCSVPAPPEPQPEPQVVPPSGYQPTAFGLPSAQELSQFQPGTSVATVIGRLIQFLLTIIGSVALGMFIYGGLLFMTSAGNAEKKKKAMLIMIWTSLGVVVMLTSYIIVNFVFQAFG